MASELLTGRMNTQEKNTQTKWHAHINNYRSKIFFSLG